jgi:ring-1,2-phenylacetyl-CoA epoxidase subunit PaaC
MPQVLTFHDELFADHPVETSVADAGVGVAPSTVADEVAVILEQVFTVSGVERHPVPQVGPVSGGTGRHGRHTEALSHLLAEMQSVARAHPTGRW